MKKPVSVFADLTMMALNVKPALRDLLWLTVNANLCSNANHSLQALEPQIATIMDLVIRTSKMDSQQSAGATLASKMMVMSFVANVKILCLLIPTVNRDLG